MRGYLGTDEKGDLSVHNVEREHAPKLLILLANQQDGAFHESEKPSDHRQRFDDRRLAVLGSGPEKRSQELDEDDSGQEDEANAEELVLLEIHGCKTEISVKLGEKSMRMKSREWRIEIGVDH